MKKIKKNINQLSLDKEIISNLNQMKITGGETHQTQKPY